MLSGACEGRLDRCICGSSNSGYLVPHPQVSILGALQQVRLILNAPGAVSATTLRPWCAGEPALLDPHVCAPTRPASSHVVALQDSLALPCAYSGGASPSSLTAHGHKPRMRAPATALAQAGAAPQAAAAAGVQHRPLGGVQGAGAHLGAEGGGEGGAAGDGGALQVAGGDAPQRSKSSVACAMCVVCCCCLLGL